MSLVVDTSALVAILKAEPEASAFADLLAASRIYASSVTLFELHCVAIRSAGVIDPKAAASLLENLEISPVEFNAEQLDAAQIAYARYGRGTKHRAQLNMGDCFSYALARTRNLPLLFKGEDFIHTDIVPALKPA